MSLSGKEKYNFNNLFIFEMANNHQGSVEHGLKIINAMAKIAKNYDIKAAIKFQFRNIDTFIHPDHKEKSDNKHIPRFISTRLTKDQYKIMLDQIKKSGLISMCTPFDEESVDAIESLGFDIIKVASCSAQDWPLLERIATVGKPVICSTGGLSIAEIDKVVSFLEHRGVHFAIEHCVAVYPTTNDKLNLNQIGIFRKRYPSLTVGFSTHEEPDNLDAIQIAYAKGARIFEKHVGMPTDQIKLNAYSANPQQAEDWIRAHQKAVAACGHEDKRVIADQEVKDLNALKRGVFIKKDMGKGELIKRSDVFFAMPLKEGQLTSGHWKEGLIANRNYKIYEPLDMSLRSDEPTDIDIIYSFIHAVKGVLNSAKIVIGHDFSVELSHHYGLKRFYEIGCIIIDCINHGYAKKLVIQLPGQWNPIHYHKAKDETFQVLHGVLEIEIEGRKKMLFPGDTLWVPPGVWHGFGTESGVIFEEVSSASLNNDSFYIDKTIARMPREKRKTKLKNWGRYQFSQMGKNDDKK